jgi:lipid-binding SYLF domain-containing protein
MSVRLLIVLLACAFTVHAQSKAAKRLQEAADVFVETMEMADQSVPQDLLNKAHCVVIVPGMKKGAFIVGGKFGRGFAQCRKEGGQDWTAPASVRVEGGSVGFQIGGSETDVIMLVMNEKGKDKLISSKFTIGGDAAAAAGPVGRNTSAQTDAQMRAEILTYSRSRGVFAGVSLDGATLRPDDKANRDLYGSALQNREILSGSVEPPEGADELRSALNKYSPKEMK